MIKPIEYHLCIVRKKQFIVSRSKEILSEGDSLTATMEGKQRYSCGQEILDFGFDFKGFDGNGEND